MSSYVAGYFTEKVWQRRLPLITAERCQTKCNFFFNICMTFILANYWSKLLTCGISCSRSLEFSWWATWMEYWWIFLIFNIWYFCYRGMDFPSVIIISYSRFAENSPGETQEAKSWSLRTSGHFNEFNSIEGDQFTLPTDTLQFNLLEVGNSRMFHDHHVDL